MTTTESAAPAADHLDLTVEGMTCGSCAAHVQKTLAGRAGVRHAAVNFATGRAHVEVDADAVDLDDLSAAVHDIGYEILSPEDAANEDPDEAAMEARSEWLRRVLVAWPLAITVMILSLTVMDETWARWTIAALTVPVQFWVGSHRLSSPARRFCSNRIRSIRP